jgi:hypothetical protein
MTQINEAHVTDTSATVEPVSEPTVKEVVQSTYENPISEINDTGRMFDPIHFPSSHVTESELEEIINSREKLEEEFGEDPAFLKCLDDYFQSLTALTYTVNLNVPYADKINARINELTQTVFGNALNKIKIGYPAFTLPEGDVTLTGDSALYYASRVSNTGRPTAIPLWSSGIVLWVDPFSETEMIDLYIRLLKKKLDIGQNTRGIMLTTDDVIIQNEVVSAILQKVSNCNIKGYKKLDLQKYIQVDDIQTLQAGALASIYPSGYPIVRTCVHHSDTDKPCLWKFEQPRNGNNEIPPNGLVNFSKMVIVDPEFIDVEEKLHMSAKPGTHTLEEVLGYQSNLRKKNSKLQDYYTVATIKNSNVVETEIRVRLKTPSCSDYFNIGLNYLAQLSNMVDKAMVVNDKTLDKRINSDENLKRLLAVYHTTMESVKHSPWIDEIIFEEKTAGTDYSCSDSAIRRIKDQKTITKTLEGPVNTLDGFKEKLNKALEEYKVNSLITHCGLPNYACPGCGRGQLLEENPRQPSLIPVNMTGYFFTIMVLVSAKAGLD